MLLIHATVLSLTLFLVLLFMSLLAHTVGLLSAQSVVSLVLGSGPILLCALLFDLSRIRTDLAIPGIAEL